VISFPARARLNSSVVLLYSVVPACYCAAHEQTLKAPSKHRSALRMPPGEGKKEAGSGLLSPERRRHSPRLFLSPVQRLNIIRTSRTKLVIIDDMCIAFWAFDQDASLKPVPCRKWSCEICQVYNAKMWAWRAELQIENDPLQWYMWTLTLGSEYKDVRKAYDKLKTLWDKLRTYMKREYSARYNTKFFTWPYMAFVEGQPQRGNMPHFHILSALPAPERIKDFAVKCGFGFMADEREINGKGAAAYVAKYASKGAAVIPKNFRRVRTSHGWGDVPAFDGKTLYVKGRAESTTAYLIRVSDATGRSIDNLWDDWKLIQNFA